MATIETHGEDCNKLLGDSCREVHLWLDELANKYPPKEFGLKHRNFRHNQKGIVEVFKYGGGIFSLAAIIHILRDKLYKCPSRKLVKKIIAEGFKDTDWEKT